MMRLNAPIPATLALAALSLLPACGLAKSTHHPSHKPATATPAVKTTSSAKKTTARKAVAEPVRDTSRHRVAGKTGHAATSRVREEQTLKARHTRHAVSTVAARRTPPEQTAAADTAPRKATSEDFLKAASGAPPVPAPAASELRASAPPVPAPVAIHGTLRPDEPTAPAPRDRRHGSVAKPVPVLSVIRPTAEKPQLDSVEEAAATPVILPALYNKRGRLIMPPPLKGSHEILVHQNVVADRDGLQRIQNDDDLLDMRNRRLLVALPDNDALQVDERLPLDRRYSRPWTAQFLATLARAHYAHFHTPLIVTSAVRTVEFQEHLIHINGNAAPAEGDTASPHLTGQAIDIGKKGLSLTEIAWMRGYLLPLVQEGKIDVEEEFQQSCFHISVYKRYVPSAERPERDLAISTHGGTSALATALR